MTPTESDFAGLEQRLDYRFADRSLLRLALTHRSSGIPNNERLEFLGDALLGCIIADRLCHRFTEIDEGHLSRLRAQLVCRESLAAIARDAEVGAVLILGPGEVHRGGHERDSILANAVEALIGATYEDSGWEAARGLVDHLFGGALVALDENTSGKDPKTRLQEWLQARACPLPVYEVVAIEGKTHDQTFHISCTLEQPALQTEAHGSTRRGAEQAAAERMMERLPDD